MINELQELKQEKLPAVLERLAEAKAMGDLSENFEYKSAMEDKDLIENGIVEEGKVSVSIILEDDTVLECVVLNIFSAGDRDYIAVMPEDDNEEGMVYLYRYSETEEGQPELTNIETDEEYEIVAEAFDELLDEEEYEEFFDENDL